MMKNECDHCREPIIGREADRLHPNGPLPVTVVMGRKALLFCGPTCARNWLEDWAQLAYGELTAVEHLGGTTELEPDEHRDEN